MNKKLKELARQAKPSPNLIWEDSDLERFAELVRDEERKGCAEHYLGIMRDAVKFAKLAKPEQEPPTLRQVVIDSALKGYGKPEQDPIAYVSGYYNGRCVIASLNPALIMPSGIALYIEPLRKEWVGLTDDEVDACFEDHGWSSSAMYYLVANALEFKLKKKNT